MTNPTPNDVNAEQVWWERCCRRCLNQDSYRSYCRPGNPVCCNHAHGTGQAPPASAGEADNNRNSVTTATPSTEPVVGEAYKKGYSDGYLAALRTVNKREES